VQELSEAMSQIMNVLVTAISRISNAKPRIDGLNEGDHFWNLMTALVSTQKVIKVRCAHRISLVRVAAAIFSGEAVSLIKVGIPENA
jgi:hypothetical protein